MRDIQMNKVLVLIDMQPHFEASQNPLTIEACKDEITNAISKGWYIFLLEWIYEGPTDSRLTRLTDGYELTSSITKDRDDGSDSIMSHVYRLGIVNSKFRVCGVNTDACVLATVHGLAHHPRGRPVEVVSAACWSDYSHTSGIERMKKFDNVKII